MDNNSSALLLAQSIKQIYGECCPLYFEITGCPTVRKDTSGIRLIHPADFRKDFFGKEMSESD